MGKTYHQIYIHVVWATKDREPLLVPEIRRRLWDFLLHYSIQHNYGVDFVNGMADHVHCLLQLRPAISVSQVVNNLKGASSYWLNEQQLTEYPFNWQRGYSAFSVSKQHLERVRKYIENQEQHHALKSFDQELTEMGEVLVS